MRTIGEILRTARETKKLELKTVSRITRINLEYLVALEENNFKKLPAATFTKGFIRNYALVIGLKPESALAIFRRDYEQDERGRIIPRPIAQSNQHQGRAFTPQSLTILISSILGVAIAGFFLHQIIIYKSAPPLEVFQPQSDTSITSPFIIAGTTKPEAVVTVNNKPIAVSSDGNFRSEASLSQGPHTLVITATNRSGKQKSIERFITIIP